MDISTFTVAFLFVSFCFLFCPSVLPFGRSPQSTVSHLWCVPWAVSVLPSISPITVFYFTGTKFILHISPWFCVLSSPIQQLPRLESYPLFLLPRKGPASDASFKWLFSSPGAWMGARVEKQPSGVSRHRVSVLPWSPSGGHLDQVWGRCCMSEGHHPM